MRTKEEFRAYVNEVLKDIRREYASTYNIRTISREEEEIHKFLYDLFSHCLDNELLKESVIQVVLIDKESKQNVATRKVRVSTALTPKKKSTAPLAYILHCLGSYKDINLFICPNAFLMRENYRKCSEDNIISSQVYFVDIDDVNDEPVYNYSKEEVIDLLHRRIPEFDESKHMPTYIVASGKGLHLYYIMKDVELFHSKDTMYKEQRFLHRNLTRKLITFWKADVCCFNLNRLLRVPYSINTKYPIRTRFIEGIPKRTYAVDELEDMTKDIRLENTKTKATPIKRERIKERFTKPKSKKPQKDESVAIWSACGKHALKVLHERRLRDLEKWFSLHKDLDMKGRRELFFFYYANTLIKLRYSDIAVKNRVLYLNSQMPVPLKKNELYHAVETAKDYKFSNNTIAYMLGFTDEEVLDFECSYTKEIAGQRKQERYQDYLKDLRDKHKRAREDKQAFRFEVIENNPDATYKELAVLMDCSLRTVSREKQKYREWKGCK